MDLHKVADSIAWDARIALAAVGMMIAMPLILIGYLVCRVSEEREMRARAADAGMTLEEYQDAVNRMAIEQINRINQEAGNAHI